MAIMAADRIERNRNELRRRMTAELKAAGVPFYTPIPKPPPPPTIRIEETVTGGRRIVLREVCGMSCIVELGGARNTTTGDCLIIVIDYTDWVLRAHICQCSMSTVRTTRCGRVFQALEVGVDVVGAVLDVIGAAAQMATIKL